MTDTATATTMTTTTSKKRELLENHETKHELHPAIGSSSGHSEKKRKNQDRQGRRKDDDTPPFASDFLSSKDFWIRVVPFLKPEDVTKFTAAMADSEDNHQTETARMLHSICKCSRCHFSWSVRFWKPSDLLFPSVSPGFEQEHYACSNPACTWDIAICSRKGTGTWSMDPSLHLV